MGLQAFAKEGQFDACRELLEQVPGETFSEVGLKTLTARLHLLEGKRDEASKGADDALVLIQDTTSGIRRPSPRATCCSALGRFHDALRSLAADRRAECVEFRYEISFGLCAASSTGMTSCLRLSEELRQAGAITDRTLLDNELSFFEKYDRDTAIKILNEEISRRPEDKTYSSSGAQGWAWRLTGMTWSIDDPSNVPAADEVEPRRAVEAVHVLKAIGQEQYAVQYAYEVIRHNFQEPDAHGAFTLALSPFGNEPHLEKPDPRRDGRRGVLRGTGRLRPSLDYC